jgi:photosystem II stability/assembly factor-like uncharacterized protein
MRKVRVVLAVLAAVLALSLCPRTRAQMKLLADNTGWALTAGHLYWTTNDGRDWKDISPPMAGWELMDDVFFLDTANGWALLRKGRSGFCCQFGLASTNNGGISWTVAPVEVPIWWNPENEVFGGGGSIDFLDGLHGWMDLSFQSSPAFNSGALFSTADGGRTWQRVKSAPMIAGEIRFFSLEDGWMLGGPRSNSELYATHDGGATWERINPQAPPGPGRAYPQFFLPVFRDASHGYLPVGFFYLGKHDWAGTAMVLFATEDGGRTWKATGVLRDSEPDSPSAVIPAAVADSTLLTAVISRPTRMVVARIAPDGRVGTASGPAPFGIPDQFSFADAQHAWAYDGGGVFSTSDGGETWTNISPIASLRQQGGPGRRTLPPRGSLSSPGTPPGVSGLASATPSGGGSVGALHTSAHLGFDVCDFLSASEMAAWWTYGPYYDVGVYLAGAVNYSSQCPAPPDSGWVGTVVPQGWGVIPIWVGPQAPCALGSYASYIPQDTAKAEALGTTEAQSAETAASQVGLPNSVIQYDMENWDYTNATCNLYVAAFIQGWVGKLDGDKWKSGLYANSRPAQAMWTLLPLSSEPDDIWVTRYDTYATIWGLDHDMSGGLADSTWGEGLRMHQYLNGGPTASGGNGTGPEQYGGTAGYIIDRDTEYAQVAGGNGGKTYTFTSDPFAGYSGPGVYYPSASGINDAYQGFVYDGQEFSGQIVGSWYDGYWYHGYVYNPYTGSPAPDPGSSVPVSVGSYNTFLKAISNVGVGDYNEAPGGTGQFVGSTGNWPHCDVCGQLGDAFVDALGGSPILIDYNGAGTSPAFSGGNGISDNCQNSGGCQAAGVYATKEVKNGVTLCYFYHGYIRPRGGAAPDISVDYNGATNTYLAGINGFGQAVGYYETSNGNFNSFLYDANSGKFSSLNLSTLAACKGASDIRARAINNNEQIVGTCASGGSAFVGFLYDFAHASSSNPLAISCGGANVTPSGINDSAEIVGSCDQGGFIAWPS